MAVHTRAGSVLLVNSFDGREMYAEYLRSTGLTVYDAATPEDAIRIIGDTTPDVVVTDLVFLDTRIDGHSFMASLRQMPTLDGTPIVVVTGYVREEDRLRARASGADLYLIKPCLPAQLLFAVRRALRQGRRLMWNWPEGPVAADRPPRERRRRSS